MELQQRRYFAEEELEESSSLSIAADEKGLYGMSIADLLMREALGGSSNSDTSLSFLEQDEVPSPQDGLFGHRS